jgi:AcrR family transcriptional regulator
MKTETSRKTDRRIVRTRRLLLDALMALIVEKGYQSVSIQDIVDRADVARTTFYLHFKDKQELLLTGITEIYNELVTQHPDSQETEDVEKSFQLYANDAADFQHVADHADFYRAMLSDKGAAEFIPAVMNYLETQVMRAHVLDLLLAQGLQPRIPLDLLAGYLAGAEIGMINSWLRNGMQHSPEELGRMTYNMCKPILEWAFGIEMPNPSTSSIE